MIEFNDRHIIVGKIKELLSTFNLPQYRIYTRENINNNYLVPTIKKGNTSFTSNMQYNPYIKDGIIQYYVKINNSYSWEILDTDNKYFSVNKKPLNATTNLNIYNNIYDSYTHEYLGNYLRFKRDYFNVDLMPLYNCFSNRFCPALQIKLDNKYVFNTNDINYKIYMVPVKLFKTYTFAIDCNIPVEVCCGIYDKYLKETPNLFSKTYKKFNSIIFNQPVIYDKLKNLTENDILGIAPFEENLKLFIKIPALNKSSIVILEGDYRHYNDSILSFNENGTMSRKQNYTETNFNIDENDFSNFKPVTPLQLLRLNTNSSYPFADRLVEYLFDNVITPEDPILDNIKRVQKVITLNNKYNEAKTDKHLLSTLVPKQPGVWEESIRAIVYDKFNKNIKANINDTNHDILGYIDKDIENSYYANVDETGSKEVTISSVDLYTDEDGLYSELEGDN